MNTNINRYVRNDISEIEEFNQVYNSVNEEFDLFYQTMNQTLLNTFITELDENGCARYEKMLGLKDSSGTIDDRRIKIFTYINGDRPYTITALKNKLEEICGVGNVYVNMDFSTHTIKILIDLTQKKSINAVRELIGRILPCNLNCIVDFVYNTHNVLSGYNHEQLSNYTHVQLKMDVLGG